MFAQHEDQLCKRLAARQWGTDSAWSMPSDAGDNDYADAANLFVRTVRADPMHYRARYRYWQIRARSGEVPDQRLQDVLVQA